MRRDPVFTWMRHNGLTWAGCGTFDSKLTHYPSARDNVSYVNLKNQLSREVASRPEPLSPSQISPAGRALHLRRAVPRRLVSPKAVVASTEMSLWLLLTLLGLTKLVVASLMLWLPFRSDAAMSALGEERHTDSDEDGGSKTLPGPARQPHPRLPLPRSPRRGGPHETSPPAPARVRTTSHRVVARAPTRH
jgi:hypothetical protein